MATGEESLHAACNSERDLTSWRQRKWVPEVPGATREEPQVSRRNSRKTRGFSPQCEMRPFSRAVSREEYQVPSCNAKVYLTPFMQLRKSPEIPVPTREENRLSRYNSRRPTFSPASAGDEGRFPCFVRKGTPTFLLHPKRRLVSP